LRAAFQVELGLYELFEAPTVAGLAARVESALRAGSGLAAPPIERLARIPRVRDIDLPLSFAQQRLWLIEQLAPGSTLYNVPIALRASGDLSVGVLARVLGEVVRRHEALRTVFREESGVARQVILPPAGAALTLVDLAGLAPEPRAAAAEDGVAAEARRPFDLACGPLLRVVLWRLSATEHLALLAMHHIVSDGWSLGVLVREVAALYMAFSEGRPSPLTELPVQYADFAVWQRGWLSGEVLEAGMAYWRRHLAPMPPVLELPADRPRPAVQSVRGAGCSIALPPPLAGALAALTRRCGSTLFMTLLAGFQALLARLCGQSDFALGTPIAGRNRLETEGLIGFFVNTLVLRADLSGDPSFVDLVGRVRRETLNAYEHQDLPFEKLVDELAPERSLAHTPLFQAMFTLQSAGMEGLSLPGLRLTPLEVRGEAAKFDLSLAFQEVEAGLACSVSYAADLFDGVTVERLLTRLVWLFEAVVADPGLPLSELRLMDAAEERLLTTGLNPGDRAWTLPATVHELFTQQATRTPDQPAAVGSHGALTYRDLEERSNALAVQIQAVLSPARLDRRICLLADPEPQILVGMLGILKAGGGFVPMDPRHPEDRQAWTLEDCGCEVLVTQRRHLEKASALARSTSRLRHVLCLEDALPLGDGVAWEARDPRELRSLAYVVYTSGSTGRPKGVQISHESLVPMLLWGCGYFGLGEQTRVLQSLSFCFDFGIFEELTTVLAGGTLYFPGEAAGDPAAFAREIARQGINTLHTTPAFAHEIAGSGEALDGLEIFHLGGEALSRATVARIRKAAPRATVYNGYGPTEATINSSIFRVDGSEDAGWPVLPIGRRSADNALYVLDFAGRLSPLGTRGELHIGGIGVARGYLNRPELTAERFVPDPFGIAPGGRLYRSGDLTRYLPGGDVEFLGRMDHQVKIRGFRIELADIESVLAALPGVAEAAVIVREDLAGGRGLVAYAVREPDTLATPALLRGQLKDQLPDYMVPAHLMVLEALPLTSNGKVDRRWLAEHGPLPEMADALELRLAPRTPTEDLLAGLFAEVLEIDGVGADADFFALGGHSLLAAQLMSRVYAVFQTELPLRVIFEQPTVAGLAQEIEQAMRLGRGLVVPPMERVARDGDLPLSFAQQRLWFIDQLEPGSSVYNMPMPFRIDGALDVGLLAGVLDAIVVRHEALRTRFLAFEGTPLQRIEPPVPQSLPVIDLRALPEAGRQAESQRLVVEETLRPFDLSRGPLLRAVLLHLAGDAWIAVFTMHHIVSDGWSLGVLVREVTTLYPAFAAGRPSPLPELPVQYADFAVWQRGWLSGEVLEAELGYWRDRLAGAPPVLALPIDRPRPAVQSSRGASCDLVLSRSLSADLAAFSRRHGGTLFMTLLAAYQVLLSRICNQSDVTVGTPIAGRNRLETETLIGFFVNTLVLRADLRRAASFTELLALVYRETLDAFAHQDLPFEKLVEELAPERSMAHTPLFQAAFVLQNAPMGDLALSGLRLTPLMHEEKTTKFDLDLLVVQGERLSGNLIYSVDLFDRSTIERLAGHLERLLESAVLSPERPLAELPLLAEPERHQLLVEWNDASVESETLCPHELFEQQAELTPEA
ncbi:MAG TPA: amino acid adenylation domain-containing protein, partial [Thermoanaerobaculia bacterium]